MMDSLEELYNEIHKDLYENEEFYLPKPRPKEKEETRKFSSERQYWIQMTADMIKAPFKVVLWKTINWRMEWIRDFYHYCLKEGKPPARLWYGLIKKSKEAKLSTS